MRTLTIQSYHRVLAHEYLIHNTMLCTKTAEEPVGELVQEVFCEIVEVVLEVVVADIQI